MSNVKFGTKIGLIAATVGSAVGLGNVWRFPAETQANGGAAFLLVYVLCVLLLGIPVMLGEFALGRNGGSDAVTDYRKVSSSKSKWWMVGSLGLLASYFILCFYMVVAGWTIEYLVHSLTGDLFVDNVQTANEATSFYQAKMDLYIHQDSGPLFYTYLMIAINLVVLMCGVRKGIERLSNMLMPLLFVILLVLVIVVLSLPGSGNGLEFFFHPDFSKITPAVVINALGQAFFSLSLGMGILITYAAYYPQDTKLMRTAVTVSLLDMLVAVMMGVIIFPAVFAFGIKGHELADETLVFVTLPEVFRSMAGSQFWAVAFFLLLSVAALTSTISIAEVSVRFFEDRFKMRRRNAVLAVIVPLILFSTICSLANGSKSDVKVFGLNIFALLNTVATNIMLPVGALLMCVFLGWFGPKRLLRDQLTNDGSLRHTWVTPAVIFIIRWIAPVLIAFVLVSQFIKF